MRRHSQSALEGSGAKAGFFKDWIFEKVIKNVKIFQKYHEKVIKNRKKNHKKYGKVIKNIKNDQIKKESPKSYIFFGSTFGKSHKKL